jgi:transcription elongation factor/antiterminator RfaH
METETTHTVKTPLSSDMQGIKADSDMEYFWYAVYVKSRHEFRVHEQLTGTQIETFLPTVERLRRWKDRKKLVTFPLFSGYLFVHIPKNKDDMLSVLKTRGVVRFLSIKHGKPDPVPEIQITSLKKLVENKAELDPYPYLTEGQRIRIKSGPLAGVEGILQERRGYQILVLSVDILQQGASVRVEALDVEPA